MKRMRLPFLVFAEVCRLFHRHHHRPIAGTTAAKHFWTCDRCSRHWSTKRKQEWHKP